MNQTDRPDHHDDDALRDDTDLEGMAPEDDLAVACRERYGELVESVGIKRFARELGLSTRQVNRMLSGAQPNAVERVIRSMQSATPAVGDRVLDFICQEMGGHFVRHEGIEDSIASAVRECAEAIAAISDGTIGERDKAEVREAISALSGVLAAVARRRG